MNWFKIIKLAADTWPIEIEDEIIRMYQEPDALGRYKSIRDIATEMHIPGRHDVIAEILKRRGVQTRGQYADVGRKRFMPIERLPDIQTLIRGFKDLYSKAQKPLSENSLSSILNILAQRSGIKSGATVSRFLEEAIPEYKAMLPKIIGRKRKLSEQVSSQVLRAYSYGYSAGKIAEYLGQHITLILYLLKTAGVVRTNSDTVALRNSLRNTRIPSLGEIFKPQKQEAFM